MVLQLIVTVIDQPRSSRRGRIHARRRSAGRDHLSGWRSMTHSHSMSAHRQLHSDAEPFEALKDQPRPD
jgi:hypothetical protein